MEKEWKVEVRLTVNDIFFFLLWHSFSSRQGKLTWGLGTLALIGTPIIKITTQDNFTTIIFLLVALMYLVVTPLSFYSNAQRQMVSNSVFKNKIVFTLKEEMLQIKQYTGEAQLFWTQMAKIDVTHRAYLLYVNSKQAFILPKRCIEDMDMDSVGKLLKEKQQELEKVATQKELAVDDDKNKKKKDKKEAIALVDKVVPTVRVKRFKLKNDDLSTVDNKKRSEQKEKNGSNRNKNK